MEVLCFRNFLKRCIFTLVDPIQELTRNLVDPGLALSLVDPGFALTLVDSGALTLTLVDPGAHSGGSRTHPDSIVHPGPTLTLSCTQGLP